MLAFCPALSHRQARSTGRGLIFLGVLLGLTRGGGRGALPSPTTLVAHHERIRSVAAGTVQWEVVQAAARYGCGGVLRDH